MNQITTTKLVFSTVDETRTAIADSRLIRMAALTNRVTYYTTEAMGQGNEELQVYSLQELHKRLHGLAVG